jgi:protein TonB
MLRTHQPQTAIDRSLIGRAIGVCAALLVFLAIPITQFMADIKRPPREIETIESVLPPPEPPAIEDKPPPEVEKTEPMPELSEPPPQLSLEQLEIALNPGMGADATGDFTLPVIETTQASLGTDEIFNFDDLDTKVRVMSQIPPVYPARMRSQGISGRVTIEVIVDREGRVKDPKIIESTRSEFEEPTINALMRWKFEPGIKNGTKVPSRVRYTIPYTLK